MIGYWILSIGVYIVVGIATVLFVKGYLQRQNASEINIFPIRLGVFILWPLYWIGVLFYMAYAEIKENS